MIIKGNEIHFITNEKLPAHFFGYIYEENDEHKIDIHLKKGSDYSTVSTTLILKEIKIDKTTDSIKEILWWRFKREDFADKYNLTKDYFLKILGKNKIDSLSYVTDEQVDLRINIYSDDVERFITFLDGEVRTLKRKREPFFTL
jgi:hypothetical protein